MLSSDIVLPASAVGQIPDADGNLTAAIVWGRGLRGMGIAHGRDQLFGAARWWLCGLAHI